MRSFTAAAIGHVQHVDAGAQLEHLARQVARAAEADRPVGQRARIGARQTDQLLDGAGRHRDMHGEHHGRFADQPDGREILHAVVAQVLVEQRIDGMAVGDHQQRIAVGLRMGDGSSRDRPVRPRPALDDELLAETRRQPLGDDARDQIDQAAGRIGHHHLDGPRRVVRLLGGRAAADLETRKQHERRQAGEKIPHVTTPPGIFCASGGASARPCPRSRCAG
jgi:hypothetical protein